MTTTAAGAQTVKLSVPQINILLITAGFLLSGEWDETITATQKNTLDRAVEKLNTALAKTGGIAP